jgi:penicillin amidase
MYWFKKFTALIITLILVAIAGLVFILDLSVVSIQEDFVGLSTEKISGEIEFYRDQYGTVHLIADKETDAYFGLGYIHAHDRLWQMEYKRRIAYGRLSELFGKKTFEIDRMMRAIDLNKISGNILESTDKKTLAVLESYCNGVNFFAEVNKNKLQFEFGALSYFPEKWTPQDCIILLRLEALMKSTGFWTDLSIGVIAENIGIKNTLDLLPEIDKFSPSVYSSSVWDEVDKKFLEEIEDTLTAEYFNPANSILELRKFLGIEASSIGTNAWTKVDKPDSISGAVLAVDPHDPIVMPAKWYPVHITFPKANVIGLSLPGIPIFFHGRNDYIAWAQVDMKIDDCDFYIEKIDTIDKNWVRFADSSYKLQFEKDTIRILNDNEFVYYKFSSKRSCIFTSISSTESILSLRDSTDNMLDQELSKYSLSFNWTGQQASNELRAAIDLSQSINWEEFNSSLDRWSVPAVNFIFSDSDGNIGIKPCALIPYRGNECNSSLPNPGWIRDYSWESISRIQIEPIINPIKQYLLAANNKLNGNAIVENYFEPSSRAVRIEQLLNQYNNFAVNDAKAMQLDLLSPYAQEIISIANEILEKHRERLDSTETEALNRLVKWDGQISSHLTSPSIYNAFMERLIFNTFSDELGEDQYYHYTVTGSIPSRKILELVRIKNSHFFDDKFTEEKENRNYIIFQSFRDAIAKLEFVFDTDNVNEWKYGKLHRLKLEHILSSNEFLRPAITLQDVQVSGNNTTINNTEYSLNDPFDAKIAPSARLIIDTKDSAIHLSMPGGVSGDVLSAYYSNQVQIWLNGGYIRLNSSRNIDQSSSLQIRISPRN